MDAAETRYRYAGPIRAVHTRTKEVRGWTTRDTAERWLRANDTPEDWELRIDKNPAWALDPAVLPRADGRPADGVPVYETADGRPAAVDG